MGTAGFELAQEWNGNSWKPLPVPVPSGGGGGLDGISCLSAARCVGVGGYETQSISFETGLFDAWNESQWSLMPTSEPAKPSGTVFWGVSCAALLFCAAVGGTGQKVVADVYR
jgi:hypothetical protein